jgi:hypothetical protein
MTGSMVTTPDGPVTTRSGIRLRGLRKVFAAGSRF